MIFSPNSSIGHMNECRCEAKESSTGLQVHLIAHCECKFVCSRMVWEGSKTELLDLDTLGTSSLEGIQVNVLRANLNDSESGFVII